MLNNITNFFNLIKTGKVKTQLDGTDLLPIGTKDLRFSGQYQPTMIKYSDLVAGLVGGSDGQVLFNDNDTIAGASGLYYDKINQRVGVGTSSPTKALHVNGNTFIQTVSNSDDGLIISNQGNIAFAGLTDVIGARFRGLASAFQMSDAAYNVKFVFNMASNLSYFNGGGNVAIGTTTDAGYKLDVNGTARFTGNVFLPTDILIGSGQSTSVWNRIMLYDVTNGSINITMHNPAWYIRHNANMSMDGAMQVGSNTSAVASAVLQATSTTKGFLPPRMTTTEKNAIATPATGLMVYDNTLNRPCFYNGTSWITL